MNALTALTAAAVLCPILLLADARYQAACIPFPDRHAGRVLAVNSSGQVLATECDLAVPQNCTAFLWTKHGVTRVASFQADTMMDFHLNDTGQVATLRSGVSASATKSIVLWSERTGLQEIGTAEHPDILRLTNSGVILGSVKAFSTREIFVAATAFGVRYMQLPATAGTMAIAGITQQGIVTGGIVLDLYEPCDWPCYRVNIFRGTPWDGLKYLNTPDSSALGWGGLAANARGEVAGSMYSGSWGNLFLWTQNRGFQRATLPSRTNNYLLLSDGGHVVGTHQWGMWAHTFVWDGTGEAVDLGTLPGLPETVGEAVNKHGQIVGRASEFRSNAFVWSRDAGMFDLGPGLASAINDAGLVAGVRGNGSRSGPDGTNPAELCVWKPRGNVR